MRPHLGCGSKIQRLSIRDGRPQVFLGGRKYCIQGPHQVGKSGKSREFCDRSGSRENVGKNKTLLKMLMCREKVSLLYRGLGLDLFAS